LRFIVTASPSQGVQRKLIITQRGARLACYRSARFNALTAD